MYLQKDRIFNKKIKIHIVIITALLKHMCIILITHYNFNFSRPSSPSSDSKETLPFLQPPTVVINDGLAQPPQQQRQNNEQDINSNTPLSSRRPSAIIAALRRPSQAIALSAAHAVMNQRRYFMK